MASKYQKNTEVKYIGKINVPRMEDGSVRVSLWETQSYNSKKIGPEIVADLPADYFPRGLPIEQGRIFRYTVDISLRFVPKRRISAREIRQIEKEIERKLRGIDF